MRWDLLWANSRFLSPAHFCICPVFFSSALPAGHKDIELGDSFARHCARMQTHKLFNEYFNFHQITRFQFNHISSLQARPTNQIGVIWSWSFSYSLLLDLVWMGLWLGAGSENITEAKIQQRSRFCRKAVDGPSLNLASDQFLLALLSIWIPFQSRDLGSLTQLTLSWSRQEGTWMRAGC